MEDPDQRIVRQADPENSEFPFESLHGFITPTRQFFVRSHFPVPEVDAGSWRLRVEGCVEHPLSLSLDELRRMPQRTLAATLECAGNSRALLEERVKGVPWQMGAVSTATWTGVSMAAVLERAGVR